MLSLHPLIDNGIKKGSPSNKGGVLRCHCPSNPVTLTLTSNVAHNHACGCSKCWKPSGALFSLVAVIPTAHLHLTSHAHKLQIVDPHAVIQRHACTACGVHMFGRIVQAHAFEGLDFVHVELGSEGDGWQEPQFAAFVSSVVEQGVPVESMGEVRAKLRSVGLECYDCLSPVLMDSIAAFTAAAANKAKL